jgi:anti-sigma regulatory factor (Ser/Thr protein kinase)
VSRARIVDAAAQGKALRLSALPTAPQQARRFVAELLDQWNVAPETVEVAKLITSELVTNAVRHAGRVDGPTEPGAMETVRVVLVRVGLVCGSVVVEVWDNSTDAPVLNNDPLDTDAEGGRGLFLVTELSKDWGYWFPPRGGKVVWAAVG